MGVVTNPLPAYTGRYDSEQFLRDLETIYKAKLNDEITAINTEKGDFSIDSIEAEAWYLDRIPKVWSYNRNVIFGLHENPNQVQSQAGNVLKTVLVQFEVLIPDAGAAESEALVYELLRYTRALKQVAYKNFDKFRGRATLMVESLDPVRFPLNGKMVRTGGVTVKASLTDN